MLFILLGLALALTGGNCVGKREQTVVVAQEGSQAVLQCAVRGSFQATHFPAFQWIKKRESTESTVCRREKSGLVYRSAEFGKRSHCLGTKPGDYSLYIDNVKQEDAGEYACSVQERHMITINYITLRVIKVSFSRPEAMEGASLEVTCSVAPAPNSLQVKWKLNGVDYNRQSYMRSSLIRIPRVSQSDKGNWTCLVKNGGNTAEATQFLSVKGLEHPPLDKALVYAGIGSNATLPCMFTKGLAINATWKRLSKESSSSSSSLSVSRPGRYSSRHSSFPVPLSFTLPPLSSSSPWDQSAKLDRVEVGDEGRYKCSGEVEGRLLEREMELVTAQVLSNPSTETTPFTLICKLSNVKEVTRYEWVRVTYDNTSVTTMTLEEKSEMLKLPSLTQEDIGEWVCRYYGARGLLGNVTYHLHLMGGLASVRAEEQSPARGALVLGLSLLVLLVLLIALQVYRNHRRKKMILPYPALENIVHSLANERENRERRRMNEKKSSGPMEEL